MDHTQALDLFKLHSNYSRSELDTQFNFEKRLLAQKLVNPFAEDETSNELKLYANTLTEAYEILSKSEEDQTKTTSNRGIGQWVQTGAALVFSGVLLGGAVHLLSEQKTVQETEQALRAQQEEEAQQNKIKAEQSNTTKTQTTVPSVLAQKKSEQQLKLEETRKLVTTTLLGWEALSKGQKISIPPSISELKSQADKSFNRGSYTQAQFLYDDFISQFSEHQDNVKDFLDTFAKNDELLNAWTALSTKEHFTFNELDKFKSQFNQVKKDLSEGHLPSYSRASLENVNLIIGLTSKRGQKIANMRQDYYIAKRRWRNRVANSGFYKMTPAIKELIRTAEQKTMEAQHFTELETVVFPRLLNHFKQAR